MKIKEFCFDNVKIERPAARAKEPSTDHGRDENRHNRACRTYEEALAQPEVFTNVIESQKTRLAGIAEKLRDKTIRRILILGCGDSWIAGQGVRAAFETLLKIPTEPFNALEYACYEGKLLSPDDLVIGISSGGNTAAVISAMRKAVEAGASAFGITNTAGSPITVEFDSCVIEATRKGWPTQSSTASMGLMIQFAIELGKRKIPGFEQKNADFLKAFDEFPGLMREILTNADTPMKNLAESIKNVRFMFFCGMGPGQAAAAFGAAKVKELCPLHAEVIPMEEFHHYRSLKPGDPLFLVAPDDISMPRAIDTAEVGCFDGGKILSLTMPGSDAIEAVSNWSMEMPDVHWLLTGIAYALPFHLFAYHLSMAKYADDLGWTPAFS